jgi:hypothetical protein
MADGWNIWSNGYIATPHTFADSGTVTLTVTAAGTLATSGWPHMVDSVSGATIGSVTVDSSSGAI